MLVPCWRVAAAGNRSIRGTQEGPSPEEIKKKVTQPTQPTASHLKKKQSKRQDDSTKIWFVSGAAEAEWRIRDRGPALFQEEYDSPRQAFRNAQTESRERWIGESTILPTSKAEAKMSCDSAWPDKAKHTAYMRERGRDFNDALRERYDLKREQFQKERGEHVSGFEAFLIAKEKEAEAARLEKEQKAKEKPKHNPVGSVLEHFSHFHLSSKRAAVVSLGGE